MKKKVISMFLTACTVSVMVVGGGSNLVMADDAETVTLMGWYDEDDMNPILEKVNEQMDGKYVIEYTYVANTDYNNVLSTQLASGEGPDIIMDGTNYPAEIKAGNVEDISDYDFVKEFNEAGLSLCSADGKIYGIPSYGWFSGIWCNASILEKPDGEHDGGDGRRDQPVLHDDEHGPAGERGRRRPDARLQRHVPAGGQGRPERAAGGQESWK